MRLTELARLRRLKPELSKRFAILVLSVQSVYVLLSRRFSFCIVDGRIFVELSKQLQMCRVLHHVIIPALLVAIVAKPWQANVAGSNKDNVAKNPQEKVGKVPLTILS